MILSISELSWAASSGQGYWLAYLYRHNSKGVVRGTLSQNGFRKAALLTYGINLVFYRSSWAASKVSAV